MTSLSLHLFARRIKARFHVIFWKWATHILNVTKRAIDLILVVPAILVLLPLFLVVALLIKINDRGPVLYWQRRVGKGGIEFDFPKFRSMCINAHAIRTELEIANQHGEKGVTFKMKRDPRITAVGRVLRRFSIDELPQLWCVLKGEMALVGPRPPLPQEVRRYSLQDRERLTVQPGLTCIWQVSGRSEIAFEQQVQMDIDYIQHRSITADIGLLFKTIPAVIVGHGAY